ncbi:MAG: hypothetical protein K2W82_17395 [Candidatus Obscuribacterales bacterium]|nr:hypothetical protein [Candidatus Obscuribacterales bacterium]
MYKRILLVEDSLRDARALALALRLIDEEALAGHLVTCISGVEKIDSDGTLVPYTEGGVAAADRDFFCQKPLSLADFDLVLLDCLPDGLLRGEKIVEILHSAGLTPVVAISGSAANNRHMCELGAIAGFVKGRTEEIVNFVNEYVK